jgi:flagellar basal body-associated protein FliL
MRKVKRMASRAEETQIILANNDSRQKSSRKTLWIIIAVLIALLFLSTILLIALMSGSPEARDSDTNTQDSDKLSRRASSYGSATKATITEKQQVSPVPAFPE